MAVQKEEKLLVEGNGFCFLVATDFVTVTEQLPAPQALSDHITEVLWLSLILLQKYYGSI